MIRKTSVSNVEKQQPMIPYRELEMKSLTDAEEKKRKYLGFEAPSSNKVISQLLDKLESAPFLKDIQHVEKRGSVVTARRIAEAISNDMHLLGETTYQVIVNWYDKTPSSIFVWMLVSWS